MGDLTNMKTWKQDPRLVACNVIPDLQEVLATVFEPSQLTPGLLSKLYHTDQPSRAKLDRKKFNISSNPNDIIGMGEDDIGSELHDTHFTPELNLVRQENAFVGLKNLGATCYMNCLLQALFHNTAFREGLYRYKPENGEEFPAVVRQLQLLFANLQNGVRAYYDPTSFVTAVGLQPQIQNDVQEFFKALTQYLEENLGKSSDPTVRTLIQDLFSGRMAYVTQCKKCQQPSRTDSLFYDLDMSIEGLNSIERSIESYIRAEELSGSNQYHCSKCNAKRDAERFIQLCDLPQELSFQLMRFVFDRDNDGKRKVKSSVEFPELLDMSQYVRREANEDDTEASTSGRAKRGAKDGHGHDKQGMNGEANLFYQLSYVLVHHGQSAHGGHYIAFVRDEATSVWWKFNDETAEPVADLAKALLSTADSQPGVLNKASKQKKPKASGAASEPIDLEVIDISSTPAPSSKSSKKQSSAAAKKAQAKEALKNGDNVRYKSSNAYMLGYTRVGREVFNPQVPDDIQREVSEQNDTFQEVIDQHKTVLKSIQETIDLRTEQYKQLCEVGLQAEIDDPNHIVLPLPTSSHRKHKTGEEQDLDAIQSALTAPLVDCQFISAEWWSSWLKGGEAASKSETEPQEPNKALMCEHGRLDPANAELVKRISPAAWALLTSYVNVGPSLDKTAMCGECALGMLNHARNFVDQEKTREDFVAALKLNKGKKVAAADKVVEATYWICKPWLELYQKKMTKREELDVLINSDIQCVHGLLSPARNRTRIPATQWTQLKSEFPLAIEFPSVLTTAPVATIPKEDKKSNGAKKATSAKPTAAKPTGAKATATIKATGAKPTTSAKNQSSANLKRTGGAQPTRSATAPSSSPVVGPMSAFIKRTSASQGPHHANGHTPSTAIDLDLDGEPAPPKMEVDDLEVAQERTQLDETAHETEVTHDVDAKDHVEKDSFGKKEVFKPIASKDGADMEIDDPEQALYQEESLTVQFDLPNPLSTHQSTKSEECSQTSVYQAKDEEDHHMQGVVPAVEVKKDRHKPLSQHLGLVQPQPVAHHHSQPPHATVEIHHTEEHSLANHVDHNIPLAMTRPKRATNTTTAARLAHAVPTTLIKHPVSPIISIDGDADDLISSTPSSTIHDDLDARARALEAKNERIISAIDYNPASNPYSEAQAEEMDVCPECLQALRLQQDADSAEKQRKSAWRRALKPLIETIPPYMSKAEEYEYCARPKTPGHYYLLDLRWAMSLRNYLKDDMVDGLSFSKPAQLVGAPVWCTKHNHIMVDMDTLFDKKVNKKLCIVAAEQWKVLVTEFGPSEYNPALLKLGARGGLTTAEPICQECSEEARTAQEANALLFDLAELYFTFEDKRTLKKRNKSPFSLTTRSRGQKNNCVRASHTDTVYNLKMRIFQAFEVPPNELVISTPDGRVMTDGDKTLLDYKLRSDVPFILHHVDPTEHDVYRGGDERNAGFGTTALMGGSRKKEAETNGDSEAPKSSDSASPASNKDANDASMEFGDKTGPEDEIEERKPSTTDRPLTPTLQPQDSIFEDWTCEHCKAKVPGFLIVCEDCKQAPTETWACGQCQLKNIPATFTKCPQCGRLQENQKLLDTSAVLEEEEEEKASRKRKEREDDDEFVPTSNKRAKLS